MDRIRLQNLGIMGLFLRAGTRLDRTCFNCTHFPLCFLRHKINDAITGHSMINIDSDDTPCTYIDIFRTLANICLKYEYQEEE